MALFIANGNFDDFHVGEIVDCDPELWADYIDVDPPFLSPVDEHGQRIIELRADPEGSSRVPSGSAVRQAGAPSTPRAGASAAPRARAKPLVLPGDDVDPDVQAQLAALHKMATQQAPTMRTISEGA